MSNIIEITDRFFERRRRQCGRILAADTINKILYILIIQYEFRFF